MVAQWLSGGGSFVTQGAGRAVAVRVDPTGDPGVLGLVAGGRQRGSAPGSHAARSARPARLFISRRRTT